MRIAQVAPLWESVPPRLYGGTERVVFILTEELVRLGHDVTLFASGDSKTAARLISPCSKALRLNEKNISDPLIYYTLMLEQIYQEAENFDLIHFHIENLQYPLFRRSHVPFVSTLQSRLDVPDLIPLYHEYAEVPVVAISNSQRKPLPWLNWQATVSHGLPKDALTYGSGEGQYLAFLGRISPEKGIEEAIEIAKRVGMKLKIAAKIGTQDFAYYESVVKPLLDHPLIEFLGEIGEADKSEFLGCAKALLFSIDWPEPFGMVMIESMACGTPVIAFNRGSVPEVIDDGISGFVVDTVNQAVRAVYDIDILDRRRIRDVFEARFSADRMTDQYLRVYESLLETSNQVVSLDRWRQSIL